MAITNSKIEELLEKNRFLNQHSINIGEYLRIFKESGREEISDKAKADLNIIRIKFDTNQKSKILSDEEINFYEKVRPILERLSN